MDLQHLEDWHAGLTQVKLTLCVNIKENYENTLFNFDCDSLRRLQI